MISPKEFKINFNLATALALGRRKKEADDFMAIAEANVPAGQEDQSSQLISDWRAGKMAMLL